MKISVNVKYMIIQGLFWMLFCVAMGFVSLYLLDEGVTNSAIGITVAVFGVASAVLQPVCGRICDKNENVSWKKMILFWAIAFSVVCVLMLFLSGKLMSAIFLGLLTMIINIIMPFVNSALFYYEGNGEKVNFGIARGIGSGAYAIVAVIIGNLAAMYGTKMVPVCGLIISLMLVVAVIFLPYSKELDVAKGNDDGSGQDNHKDGFIKKYPTFMIMVVGFVLLLATHNITCNFMLQIIQNLGGDSSNLGTCMAIQAVVEVPVMFCFALLLKKFSPTKLMIISAIGYLIKATCFYLAGSVYALYTVQLAQIISFAVFASASVYYTGEMVGDEDRTTGQSVMAGAIVAGNVVGSLVGGRILDLYGIKNMLLINIMIAGVGALIAGASAYASKRHNN